jgi:hypothetical protein
MDPPAAGARWGPSAWSGVDGACGAGDVGDVGDGPAARGARKIGLAMVVRLWASAVSTRQNVPSGPDPEAVVASMTWVKGSAVIGTTATTSPSRETRRTWPPPPVTVTSISARSVASTSPIPPAAPSGPRATTSSVGLAAVPLVCTYARPPRIASTRAGRDSSSASTWVAEEPRPGPALSSLPDTAVIRSPASRRDSHRSIADWTKGFWIWTGSPGPPSWESSTRIGPVSTSMVCTADQSMSSPSRNSHPRQKLANSGPGKMVGWATPNRAPSPTLAAWMPPSVMPSWPWRCSATDGVSPKTVAWPA